MKKEKTTRKAQGCYRAGIPRPWLYKGGRSVAQAKYRKKHAEEIKAKKKIAYHKNPEAGAARTRAWRNKNPGRWLEIVRKANRAMRERLRKEMFLAYGVKCSCCGEKELMFLELDHINNDGSSDRKSGRGSGVKLLLKLKKEGWPKDQFQILCSNCNKGKRRNGGICPHKTKNL